jgi:hypothetical protein
MVTARAVVGNQQPARGPFYASRHMKWDLANVRRAEMFC